jgi:hypothetical protein
LPLDLSQLKPLTPEVTLGAQHGWCNIDYIDVAAVAAAAVEAPAEETTATDAAATDAAADLPDTGDSTVVIPLLIAGAGCFVAAILANKKLRKNILN